MKTTAKCSTDPTTTKKSLSQYKVIKSTAMKKRKLSELSSPTISARRIRGKRLVWRDVYAEEKIEIPWYGGNSGRETAPVVVMGQVSGIAEAGHVTFLMGDTGSGKSVLLSILAQKAEDLKIYGEIEVNGRVAEPGDIEDISSYVGKTDYFMDTLTVHETLTMAATLRLKCSQEEKEARVNGIATEMELHHIMDERIGTRKIGKGAMKRLSIACEVVVDRAITFFDEPTLGLDLHEAILMMKILRDLSREGKTVICAITQPSSEVFQMADWIVLLAKGQVAFQGPALEAGNFFVSCGLPCPQYHAISDHILRSVVPQEAQSHSVKKIVAAYNSSEYCRHVHSETHKYDAHNNRAKMKMGTKSRREFAASWGVQFACLFKRSFKSTFRKRSNFLYRALQCLLIAVIQGLVFFRTKLTADTILTGRGIAFEVVRSMDILFIIPTIRTMLLELPVVYRDYQRKMYYPGIYLLGKATAETIQDVVLPFLHITAYYWLAGLSYDIYQYLTMVAASVLETFIACSVGSAAACIFGDIHRATFAAVMFSLPMLLFSGFFIDVSSIPVLLQPFTYLSWLRYGYMVNLAAIFHENIPGCPTNNSMSSPCEYANGPKLLESWGADPQYNFLRVMALVLLIIAWRTVAIIALSLRLWRLKV